MRSSSVASKRSCCAATRNDHPKRDWGIDPQKAAWYCDTIALDSL